MKKSATFSAVPFALGVTLAAVAFAGPASATARVTVDEVVLTNKDNGRTVTVRSGDNVRVQLTGTRTPGAVWAWSTPVTGDPWVVFPTGSVNSPDGSVTTDFRAKDPGTTTIDSYKRCIPDLGHLCAQVIIPWKATVVVK
ncbi:hypothetical protein AB0F13_21320 [Streptomyces sp. NPDC026206]|uniref:hypothetical protein n=1 Tax=Streptomyces sp. NPDC026206 TaxID=3157089 RepID=UPI0033ECA3BB